MTALALAVLVPGLARDPTAVVAMVERLEAAGEVVALVTRPGETFPAHDLRRLRCHGRAVALALVDLVEAFVAGHKRRVRTGVVPVCLRDARAILGTAH